MRRLVGVVVVLVLAGCSGGGPSPSASRSTSSSSSSSASGALDSVFLSTVRERSFDQWTDAELLKQRGAACHVLDTEPTSKGWVEVLKVYLDKGVDANDAGYLIGLMVQTGCPEHADVLPQ